MNQPAMQLPAWLTTHRPSRSLVGAAASGLGAARPAHISRRGNRFTLVDAAGNTKPVALMDPQTGQVYIDLVVLDANEHPSRMYFDGPYNENDPDPPACWSDNGLAPSSQAAKPQAPTCAVCPMSAWGSKISPMSGAGIPACQSAKKLAVLAVHDTSDIIYEFTVPPGSFSDKESGWRRYVNTIGAHGVDLCDVVTRVSFVPNSMGVLAFQPVALLDEPLAERRLKAWETKTTDQIVGRLDKPRDPNLPLAARPVAQEARPAGQGQLPPPPAQPAVSPAGFGQPATAGPAPFVTAQTGTEPPKRTRRTKAEMEAARAAQGSPPAQGNGQDGLDIPPFLQRAPQPAQQVGQQAMPLQPGAQGLGQQAMPGTQFGLQQPQAPDKGLQDALAAAFNLKTT